MSWKAYRLIYKLKSPLHIGWHTMGYIKLTRRYILGTAIWGAAVANTTRIYSVEGVKGYETFKHLYKTDILLGYFFPAIDKVYPLLPRFIRSGQVFGYIKNGPSYSAEDFDQRFISTFSQTAVAPQHNTAEDESLHESEFISPFISEDGEQKNVYFIGYIFIKGHSGLTVNLPDRAINLVGALRELFIGGDIKYGWGRMVLVNDPLAEGIQQKVFGYDFISGHKHPVLQIPNYSTIPAHLRIDESLAVRGDIEPLVGRQWQGNDSRSHTGAGQKIKNYGLYWMPGSEIIGPCDKFKVEPFGVLSPMDSEG